jgi:hypothetical protein
MPKGDELKFQGGAATNTEGEQGNEGRKNRDHARKYQIDALAEALAEGLSVGHPDMPVFVFEPDEVGAILEYLKSIQQP